MTEDEIKSLRDSYKVHPTKDIPELVRRYQFAINLLNTVLQDYKEECIIWLDEWEKGKC
jgi:hypothetical protein